MGQLCEGHQQQTSASDHICQLIIVIGMGFRCLLGVLCLLETCLGINFLLTKKNVFIPANSQYISQVEVHRENADLIPINMSVQNTVTNTIPSYNSYFDYFYFLTPQEVACYQQAVNNQSFLFPCPFVNSKNTLRRASYVRSDKYNQSLEEIHNLTFSFIIDNTLFPYPSGAYGYAPINVDVSLEVVFKVSSNYEVLGTRLIFITTTIFLIFITIIIILACKTRSLNRKMSASNLTQNERDHLQSVMNNEDSDSSSSQEEEESTRELRQRFLEREESMVEEVGDDPVLRKSIKSVSAHQQRL